MDRRRNRRTVSYVRTSGKKASTRDVMLVAGPPCCASPEKRDACSYRLMFPWRRRLSIYSLSRLLASHASELQREHGAEGPGDADAAAK
jgi:hypothetical protein